MRRWTKVIWETRNGSLINLSDMSERHILNCIAMIEKSIKAGKPWRAEALKYLKLELSDRHKVVFGDWDKQF